MNEEAYELAIEIVGQANALMTEFVVTILKSLGNDGISDGQLAQMQQFVADTARLRELLKQEGSAA
jgi:hypothetical protein